MKKLFWIAIVISGCSGDNFPKYQTVETLRVLALKTTTPEISPGDTVPSVSALVLDPNGNSRAITYEWKGCFESLTEISTKRYECIGSSDMVSLGSATTSQGGVVTIPTTILASVSSAKSYNGLNYIVALTVTAGTEHVKAFKRIVVSESGKTKNSNPTVINIQQNGAALSNGSALPAADTELTANIAQTDFETFSYKDTVGNLKSSREDILVTWFATEGKWTNTRTYGGDLKNFFAPPSPKVKSSVTIAVVAHDGRGGIDWQTVELQ